MLAACVPLPSTGPRVPDARVESIVIGQTSDREVESRLGEPDVIWQTERVWVYEHGTTGRFAVIAPYGGGGVIGWLGRRVLIMRFDPERRVERIEVRSRSVVAQTYGEFLRKWLAEGRGPAPAEHEPP